MLEQPRKREKRYTTGKGEDSFIRYEDRERVMSNKAYKMGKFEEPATEQRATRVNRADARNAGRTMTNSASAAASAASAAKSVGKGVSGKNGSAGRTMKNSAVNAAAIASTAKSFGKGVSRASNISGMYEKAFGKKKPSRR